MSKPRLVGKDEVVTDPIEPAPVPTDPAPTPEPDPVPPPVDDAPVEEPKVEEPKVEEPKDKDFGPPEVPTDAEIPDVVVAPEAIDPTAVGTTESGLKYGWQQPSTKVDKEAEICMHMGIVQARKQVAGHDVGHEWVCTCGTVFVVKLNAGDKRILKEKAVG